MFDLKDMQRNIAREQRDMQKGVARNQRDIQKSIAKDLKFSISKEGRIRIPAKRRHEVEEKCHYKCHYPKCTIPFKSHLLHYHHINMKNNDNRLSNLELLCPTHHSLKHQKAFRRKITRWDIYKGTQTTSRLIKKKPKITTKRRHSKSKTSSLFEPLNYKPPKIN